MRVGLYFGTFDPLHNGHLAIVGYMLSHSPLSSVWFVPSPQSPHKMGGGLSPFADRCAAIERTLGALQESRLGLCTIEGRLSRPSYTMQTLCALGEEHPHCEFALIMGSDNVERVLDWREGAAILSAYSIYVYPRRGWEVSSRFLAGYPTVRLLDAPLVEISSTAIREGRAMGRNMDFYVPLVLTR